MNNIRLINPKKTVDKRFAFWHSVAPVGILTTAHKLVWHCLCAVTIGSCMCRAADIGNSDGWEFGCDHHGVPQCSFLIDTIRVPGLSVPVRLNFNANDPNIGILPEGWTLPSVDSRAIALDETHVRIIFPDGSTGDYSIPAEASIGISDDLNVKGNVVKVTKRGVTYLFDRGLISQISTAKGLLVEYQYDKGRLQKIVNGSRDTLLSVEYFGGEPIRQMTLTTGSGQTRKETVIEYEHVRAGVKEILKQIQYHVPHVTKVTKNANTETEESYEIGGFRGEENGLTITRRNLKGESFDTLNATWEQNGRLKAVNGLVVQYFDLDKESENDLGSYRPQISVMDVVGQRRQIQEGYSSQSSKGVQRYFSEGKIFEKHVIATPLGAQVRKETLNGEEIYKAWFDSGGKLLKDQRGKVHRILKDGKYHVYSDGKLIRTY